jgi:hypothetical protein
MQRTSAFGASCLVNPAAGSSDRVCVGLVNLLGVRVSARAILNQAEHERRRALGITALTDPALLGRLLELPVGCSVLDPVVWAETAGQPTGVVIRGDDGHTVTRLLEPALTVEDVIVPGPPGHEMQAVQDASLFASFTTRWVTVEAQGAPDAMVMEAKLCGVGLLGQDGQVILAAEQPTSSAIDGWAWLLWEKTYRRWLKEHSPAHETGNQAQATGEASATPTS